MVEALRGWGHEEYARALDGLDTTSFVAAASDVAAHLPPEPAGLVMMAADTSLAERRQFVEREPRLRSHLEAVAATRSTYGAIAGNVAFVIARSTASLHPDGDEIGFTAERAWQLNRLLDQLDLGVPAPA